MAQEDPPAGAPSSSPSLPELPPEPSSAGSAPSAPKFAEPTPSRRRVLRAVGRSYYLLLPVLAGGVVLGMGLYFAISNGLGWVWMILIAAIAGVLLGVFARPALVRMGMMDDVEVAAQDLQRILDGPPLEVRNAGDQLGQLLRIAEERIARDQQRLAELSELAETGYGLEALFDSQGRLLWINAAVERLTGHTVAACLSADDPLALLIDEADLRHCRKRFQDALTDAAAPMVAASAAPHATEHIASQGVHADELRLRRTDAGVRWVAFRWLGLRDAAGRVERVRLSAEDVQSRKESEYRLLETVAELRRAQALSEHYLVRSQDERQRLGALLGILRVGIMFMDRDQRVQYFNRAMTQMWGFDEASNLIGARDVVLQRLAIERLAEPEAYFEHIRQVLESPESHSAPHDILLVDGTILCDTSALVRAADGHRAIGRIWTYEDVTEARTAARKLVELAERDALTNLFNRRRFHEEIERLLAEARRNGEDFGLLMIDLDGFKPINDAHGHQAGDEMLVRIAADLGRIVRRHETLYRLGGDEFAVLVPDADIDDLRELGRRILQTLNQIRMVFHGEEITISASIGTALNSEVRGDAERLIGAADRAMYAAKEAGKNRWA